MPFHPSFKNNSGNISMSFGTFSQGSAKFWNIILYNSVYISRYKHQVLPKLQSTGAVIYLTAKPQVTTSD